MRIEEHPILGQFEKGPRIQFTYDGKAMEGFEGEPIAIALRSNGVMIHRYTSRRNEPRGMFCAIGRCTDCIMVVDGHPNILLTQTVQMLNIRVNPAYQTDRWKYKKSFLRGLIQCADMK